MCDRTFFPICVKLRQEKELAGMDESERKKYLSKQRKAAARKAAEDGAAASKKDGRIALHSACCLNHG
jgi:hypothetical protein